MTADTPTRRLVPAAALDWLNGIGPDHEGFHFGEGDYPKKGNFWWRKRFREVWQAASPNAGRVSEAEVEKAAKIHTDSLFDGDIWSTLDDANKKIGIDAMRSVIAFFGLEVE